MSLNNRNVTSRYNHTGSGKTEFLSINYYYYLMRRVHTSVTWEFTLVPFKIVVDLNVFEFLKILVLVNYVNQIQCMLQLGAYSPKPSQDIVFVSCSGPLCTVYCVGTVAVSKIYVTIRLVKLLALVQCVVFNEFSWKIFKSHITYTEIFICSHVITCDNQYKAAR